jgi:hypothetical protein
MRTDPLVDWGRYLVAVAATDARADARGDAARALHTVARGVRRGNDYTRFCGCAHTLMH